MGFFRYEAVDKTGKVVRGVMNAPDEGQVASNLSAMGYSPRAIFGGAVPQTGPAVPTAAPRAQTGARSSAAAQAVAGPGRAPVSVKSRVPASGLATFFRQLATLVKAGRPLAQSAADIFARDRRIRRILPEIQVHIGSGESLSSAMAVHPDIFPVHATASVWSGELAGKLDIALDEVAADFELEASETRFGRIGWGLTKLNVLCIVLMAPMLNMGRILAPFAQDSPTGPSTPVEFLLLVGRGYLEAILRTSLPITAAIVVSWIIWGRLKRVPEIRRYLDGVLLSIPVWGKLHRYRAIQRFLHEMDGLYAAGIAPSTAWQAASLTPKNSVVAERLRLARDRSPADSGLVAMCGPAGLFDLDDIGVLAAGEKAGDVPAALATLSSAYADRAAAQRTIARMWSVSILITFLLILGGGAMMVIASTYVNAAFKIVGM